MDASKIRAILSAVKYKSLSKAAEELSYTPSAMSHIADSLEKELGVKILERSPLGVEFTAEGEQIAPKLYALLAAEDELLRTAHAISESKSNHLRIGTFSSISQNMLPEILRGFRELHPDISVSIAVEDSLHDWTQRGLADVIFTDNITHGENIWVPIKEDPFVAIVPSHMAKGKRSITREELYGYTYISINDYALTAYFDMSKFTKIIPFESVDNVSVLYMIQEGLGVSVLPSLMLSQRIKGVSTLKLKPSISRTLGFAYSKDQALSYAAKTFVNYLKRTNS